MTALLKWLLGIETGMFAGADSWSFRFLAEFTSGVRLLLLVVLVGMVVLTVRSYRREGDTPRRAKALMAGLRIAVIAALLAVLLRPAIVLRYEKELRSSTVVVLVDESLSMGFEDRYVTDEHRQALAASVAVEPDALTSMARLEIARAALGRDRGVLTKLRADHPLLVVGFSSDRTAKDSFSRIVADLQPPEQADDAAADDEIAPTLQALAATGYSTDLARAIRDALERMRGRRLGAIVVVSDGQITAPGGDTRLAAAVDLAGDSGVPVYAVMVGDPTPRKNLTVIGLDGPDRLRRRASGELTVLLAARNLDGHEIDVVLMRRAAGEQEWQETDVKATVDLSDPEDGEGAPAPEDRTRGRIIRVPLHLEPKDLGEFEYRAEVAPLPGEQDLDDNASRPLRIYVADEKINVLLVSGDAGWEFQYLKNFLVRAEDVYRVSIWQQNADKEVNQAASTGMKLTQLPRHLAQLIGVPGQKDKPGYQVVILIDPQPTAEGFDAAFVEMLGDYVSQHGGGLCYVAGNKYTDSILAGGGFKTLAGLLPVILSDNTVDLAERLGQRRPQPWTIRLTSYGRDHQIMRMGSSAERTQAVWDLLPGIFWSHPVRRLKLGARVLAEHSNPLRRAGRNTPEPLVVVQSPGAGRVAYVGFDSTWRWRFVQDGYYHRRFWANLVRYLARSGTGKRITITTGGERFVAGRPITIEVEAYDEAFAPVRARTFDVEMIDTETGQRHTITLAAVDPEKQPGYFKGDIDETVTAHQGRYRLTAMVDDPNADQIVAAKEIVIELPQAESLNKEAGEATMRLIGSRSIAAGSNEAFLPLRQIDKLAEWIPPGRKRSILELPRELWDTRLALLLIVALLTAEWILRKKHNLA
ncbi:hypothetical protein LCGC14_0269020 [marine sediment metagenome]|uniref:VWFA domain-containing protein n=1 Tax=marine sediment metagenome TaxID=412755 RepID=A0A0F9X4B8_9ZZZZ|nr:VWA domain-containing protein [Phycisphaerae bacterium]